MLNKPIEETHYQPANPQSPDDIPYPLTLADYMQLCKRIAALEARIAQLEGSGE